MNSSVKVHENLVCFGSYCPIKTKKQNLDLLGVFLAHQLSYILPLAYKTVWLVLTWEVKSDSVSGKLFLSLVAQSPEVQLHDFA